MFSLGSGVWVTVRVRRECNVSNPGIEIGLTVFVTSRMYSQTNSVRVRVRVRCFVVRIRVRGRAEGRSKVTVRGLLPDLTKHFLRGSYVYVTILW